MNEMQSRAGLSVADCLAAFIEDKALPGTGVAPDRFWRGLADILARFTPENRALLAERDRLQARLDAWHVERRGKPIDTQTYLALLRELGYLVPEPATFKVESRNV